MCSKFQERWSLKTQTLLDTLTERKFFGAGGIQRPGGDDENFWSYGRGIPLRRPSGSPRRISAIKTHSEQILRPTESQKGSDLSSVSEDRNFSRGREVVGILVLALGVAMGAGLA